MTFLMDFFLGCCSLRESDDYVKSPVRKTECTKFQNMPKIFCLQVYGVSVRNFAYPIPSSGLFVSIIGSYIGMYHPFRWGGGSYWIEYKQQ